MSNVNLISLLSLLCEIDPPEVTGQSILEGDDRQALESLLKLSALVHVGNREVVLCLACDEPHSVVVEYVAGNRYRAYCVESGYQEVRAEEIKRLAVAEKWIAEAIGSSLGLKRSDLPATSTSSGLVRIGRAKFGPYACDLFFGRRLSERSRFDEAKRVISGLAGKVPAIVVTTTPTDSIPGEPPARCAIVALQDVFQVDGTRISLEEGPFLAALRGTDRRFREAGIGFKFSSGFRSAVVGEQDYRFTDKQALAIEALYDAWRSGNPRLHQTEIKGMADTSQRVGQLFAGHPAYGVLIKHDAGYYWLDL